MDLILIGLGLPELGVILLIVIVIFGASRLPQLGKGLGEGIKNFKSSLRDGGERSAEKKNDEAES